MGFARVACRAQVGLDAPLVTVEVSLAAGLPALFIVGLPATVVRESKERVRAALLHSHFEFPAGRITVNLAPADLPKEGGRFDLPIALGVLLASRQLAASEFYGELGLTGELKAVRALLPAAAAARRAGHELIVPRANVAEACAVAAPMVYAADHLLEVCAHVTGVRPLPRGPGATPAAALCAARGMPDLADVRGQLHAKRALMIAAAGGHSLLKLLTIGALQVVDPELLGSCALTGRHGAQAQRYVGPAAPSGLPGLGVPSVEFSLPDELRDSLADEPFGRLRDCTSIQPAADQLFEVLLNHLVAGIA